MFSLFEDMLEVFYLECFLVFFESFGDEAFDVAFVDDIDIIEAF